MSRISITEASRDALQGIKAFMPTDEKIAYLQALMQVGFAQIDCVSFVSPKAIPQLRDSTEVIAKVAGNVGHNKLLAIVANPRGAIEACRHPALYSLGYPLSLSETFQQRNTKRNIQQAIDELQSIQSTCQAAKKSLLVFLSMGFGNPYGDAYSEGLLLRKVEQLLKLGVRRISVADTVGLAPPKLIEHSLGLLLYSFPEADLGVHLHARPEEARDKIAAAYQAGCQYFDAAMQGYGGCPMAEDKLVGNIATETLTQYLHTQGEALDIDEKALHHASRQAKDLFSTYH